MQKTNTKGNANQPQGQLQGQQDSTGSDDMADNQDSENADATSTPDIGEGSAEQGASMKEMLNSILGGLERLDQRMDKLDSRAQQTDLRVRRMEVKQTIETSSDDQHEKYPEDNDESSSSPDDEDAEAGEAYRPSAKEKIRAKALVEATLEAKRAAKVADASALSPKEQSLQEQAEKLRITYKPTLEETKAWTNALAECLMQLADEEAREQKARTIADKVIQIAERSWTEGTKPWASKTLQAKGKSEWARSIWKVFKPETSHLFLKTSPNLKWGDSLVQAMKDHEEHVEDMLAAMNNERVGTQDVMFAVAAQTIAAAWEKTLSEEKRSAGATENALHSLRQIQTKKDWKEWQENEKNLRHVVGGKTKPKAKTETAKKYVLGTVTADEGIDNVPTLEVTLTTPTTTTQTRAIVDTGAQLSVAPTRMLHGAPLDPQGKILTGATTATGTEVYGSPVKPRLVTLGTPNGETRVSIYPMDDARNVLLGVDVMKELGGTTTHVNHDGTWAVTIPNRPKRAKATKVGGQRRHKQREKPGTGKSTTPRGTNNNNKARDEVVRLRVRGAEIDVFGRDIVDKKGKSKLDSMQLAAITAIGQIAYEQSKTTSTKARRRQRYKQRLSDEMKATLAMYVPDLSQEEHDMVMDMGEAQEGTTYKFESARALLEDTVKANQYLSEEQKERLIKGVRDLERDGLRLAADAGDAPPTTFGTVTGKGSIHTIVLKPFADTDKAISPRRYYSWAKKDALLTRLGEWIQMGIVSETPVGKTRVVSMPVVAAKYDSTGKIKGHRVAVDFRLLNELTDRDAYAGPRIDEVLETMCQGAAVSVLDGKALFHQFELDPASRHLTNTYMPDGRYYEFNRSPFGLRSIGATCQRFMDEHLRTDKVRPYVDDVPISHEDKGSDEATFEAVVDDVLNTLEKCRNCNLTINVSKAVIGQKKTLLLGHDVDCETKQYRPHMGRLEVLRNYVKPTTNKSLRRFLAKCTAWSRFVPGWSTIGRRMNKIVRHNQPLVWTPDAEEAFEQARQALTKAVAVAVFNPDKPTHVFTDACKTGIAYIIAQEDDDSRMRMISAGGRPTAIYEQNHHVGVLEVLAFRDAVQKEPHYVLGRQGRVIWHCDNVAATRIATRTLSPKSDAIRRYLLELQHGGALQVEMRHVSGNENPSDAISRQWEDEPVNMPGPQTVFTTVEQEQDDEWAGDDARQKMSAVMASWTTEETRRPNRWYTPKKIIEKVHTFFGNIDLDPASDTIANQTVQAKKIFNAAQDGKSRTWRAKTMWLNPPWDELDKWIGKAKEAVFVNGTVEQALVMVPTDKLGRSRQLQRMLQDVPFISGSRITFKKEGKHVGSPRFGTAIYFMSKTDRTADLADAFADVGDVMMTTTLRPRPTVASITTEETNVDEQEEEDSEDTVEMGTDSAEATPVLTAEQSGYANDESQQEETERQSPTEEEERTTATETVSAPTPTEQDRNNQDDRDGTLEDDDATVDDATTAEEVERRAAEDETLMRQYNSNVQELAWATRNDKSYIAKQLKAAVNGRGTRETTRTFQPALDAVGNITVNHKGNRVLYVPGPMRKEAMTLAHACPQEGGGHRQHASVVTKLMQRVWWPGLSADVKAHIKDCAVCQQLGEHPKTTFLGTDETKRGRFEHVHVDLAQFESGADAKVQRSPYVLVMVDRVTGALEYEQIADKSPKTVIEAFNHTWVQRYGAPIKVTADDGTDVSGKEIEAYALQHGIDWNNVTPKNQRANGIAERAIRTFKAAIRAYSSMTTAARKHSDWYKHLAEARWSYWVAVSRVRKHTPYELVYGQAHVSPLDRRWGTPAVEASPKPSDVVREHAWTQEQSDEFHASTAQDNIKKTTQEANAGRDSQHERDAERAKKNKGRDAFTVGELVWKRNAQQLDTGFKNKIKNLGPYEIVVVDHQRRRYKIRSWKTNVMHPGWIAIHLLAPCTAPKYVHTATRDTPEAQLQKQHAADANMDPVRFCMEVETDHGVVRGYKMDNTHGEMLMVHDTVTEPGQQPRIRPMLAKHFSKETMVKVREALRQHRAQRYEARTNKQ